MNKTVVAIVAVVILLIGGLALANKNDNKNPATNNTTSNQSQNTPANDNADQNDANQSEGSTITYSSNGFSPSTLTVKAGSDITIKNTSSSPLDFESDPHPQHTDNTELNVGTIASGQSKTFTVTTKVTWGYHNHLNPSDTGTIIVQ